MSDDREEREIVGMLERIAIAQERIATLAETILFVLTQPKPSSTVSSIAIQFGTASQI